MPSLIVNAANSSLLGGGGVDGAIHRAGGPVILEACREINRKQGGCRVGEAVLTIGGNLPARFVIHTVGPVWHGGHRNEERHLSNAYRNSLKLALDKSISSLAFPNISTGVYGYPKNKAAHVAIRTVQNFMEQHSLPEKVIFVCYDEENYGIYHSILEC